MRKQALHPWSQSSARPGFATDAFDRSSIRSHHFEKSLSAQIVIHRNPRADWRSPRCGSGPCSIGVTGHRRRRTDRVLGRLARATSCCLLPRHGAPARTRRSTGPIVQRAPRIRGLRDATDRAASRCDAIGQELTRAQLPTRASAGSFDCRGHRTCSTLLTQRDRNHTIESRQRLQCHPSESVRAHTCAFTHVGPRPPRTDRLVRQLGRSSTAPRHRTSDLPRRNDAFFGRRRSLSSCL
jgi:hypothetical protein